MRKTQTITKTPPKKSHPLALFFIYIPPRRIYVDCTACRALLQAGLCHFPRARLFPRDSVFAHGALIGFIYAYVGLYGAVDFKVQCLASPAVNKTYCCDYLGSEALKEIFYLHCGLSCCYYVLSNYDSVAGGNFKTSS